MSALPSAEGGTTSGSHPFRLEIHETLVSTSDTCIAAARARMPGDAAVLARRQSAGRGSRGRGWATGEGNLALSILLRPGTPAADAGQWSLLAGLAVIEALSGHVDDPGRLRLKWPNDVMLDEAKLAGILIDTQATADGRLDWLVIGIGVNLAAAPALPDRATAALGGSVAPETMAQAILERVHAWRIRWGSEGSAPIRDAWVVRAHQIGRALTVRLGTGSISGQFAGLSAGGALLVATDAGVRTIHSAEIALR